MQSSVRNRPGPCLALGEASLAHARATGKVLATLENLVAEKNVVSRETLHRYRDAWDHAADRTPHGTPIELKDEDFG